MKTQIQLNSYPENYEEEEMPQIVVEIRYKKGQETRANNLAKKLMMIIDKIDGL